MKKIFCLICILFCSLMILTGCEESTPSQERVQIKAAQEAAGNIVENQPVPTDIEYSLERYNVIKRAYWVNGQREKAMALPCAVQRPLGYIVLLSDSGAIVGKFIVDGKVSSLNSYLFPAYEQNTIYSSMYDDLVVEREVAGIDGTYGENVKGIFFFDVEGNYWEWNGNYLYSDVPMEIDDPIIHYEGER
mgnify:CR=1 FL=1